MLIAVVFPDHITVPIDLNQIDIILNAEFRISSARTAQHVASGEDFGRKADQPLPQMHLLTAHIDQHNPFVPRLENCVATPCLGRIIYCRSCRIYR
ncbi:hypothetical protein D3C75_1201310 [compost metagenome]